MGISVARLGTTSVHTRHHVWRGLELLVEASLPATVFVDVESYKSTPIPNWAHDGLMPWLVEVD